MNNKVLFFDLDDTLIKCSGYYYEVEDRILSKFIEYNPSYTLKELKKTFNDKQWSNVKDHGYGPPNFMYSAMQIGAEIVGYNFFKDNLIDFINNEVKPLFDSPLELLDGVEETVRYLHDKGYRMSIITKGANDVQKNRVEKLSINQFFNSYEIVKHKEKDDYLTILEKYKLDAENCYMIGNSPKGDINEAKLAGFKTIFIPNEHTWEYEDVKIIENGPKTIILNNIKELIKINL
jgi:putative hydrolase of the HAD superfamily